jgi:hypothetical protein
VVGDGGGPVGGRGGAGGNTAACSGVGYFEQQDWCASTYEVQAAKQVGGCSVVRVYTGPCSGDQVWRTAYSGLGDPLLCAYDATGNLTAARICTDTPVAAWNCTGAAQSPNCLSAGTVPDVGACALTTNCP